MVLRYKVVSGLMALAAAFLVVISLQYLKISQPTQLNKNSASISLESSPDWDNDGLKNNEESFWNTDPNKADTDGDGYLDGEETVSGHDPLIKAPGDLLPTNDNLTMKISQLALAGLYEGSLKQDSPNYEGSINNLVSSITDEATDVFKANLSSTKLKITGSDKYSQQTYIEELSPIYETFLKTFVEQMIGLENNLNSIGQYGFSNTEVSKSFIDFSSRYKNILDDLFNIIVPKNWTNQHLGLIKFIDELSLASQSIVSGQNDPIKAYIGLNKIVQLWEVFPKITETYSQKIQLENLNQTKIIFKH